MNFHGIFQSLIVTNEKLTLIQEIHPQSLFKRLSNTREYLISEHVVWSQLYNGEAYNPAMNGQEAGECELKVWMD